ncbi:hypothetical protein [Streptomyces sp. NPDC002276]
MIDGARDMAKALDQYADVDVVHKAVKHLEHELEIVGATIVAGTALAVFTFGISEGAAAAATASTLELSATLGVTVSTEIATDEGKGLSLDEVSDSALYGVEFGGAAPSERAGGRPGSSPRTAAWRACSTVSG